jgi:TP901 family phage tail tape measure protein
MAKKVENKDLFADDLMGKTIKDVELLIVELDKLEAKIVTVAKAQKTILEKEDSKSIGSIQRTTKAVNELSEAEKIQQNLLKQKQTLETKLKSARTVQAQQNAETNLLLKEQIRIVNESAKADLKKAGVIKLTASEQKRLAKETELLTNKYKILTNDTNKAQANFKKLAAEFGVNSKQAKAAKIEFDKLDNRLRSINNAANDGRRDVGRYGLAFQKLGGFLKGGLGFLGITAGIGAVSSVISGAFTTIKDFEQSIADLGAITGATGTDLDKFQKEVLRVSKSTGKGAVDIAKAFQIVGSAQPELLSSAAALGSVTEAAVLLSKAGNIDVPEAANSLALAMNQFGASALEAASYTDILATSQQKGTATIPQLSESLKNVGSVARASGLSFETTNAALQGLAKGGLVGAEAGTKLRTILLRLAKTGRDDLNPATQKFSDILGVLKKEVGTVTDAQKLFGEEAAAAALTLINQKQVIEDLDGALNVNGAALEQAAQRYNTIDW